MKGRFFRILLCSVMVLILAALLIACGDNDDDKDPLVDIESDDGAGSESQSESESDAEAESESAPKEMDSSKFNIFFDKEYVCTFVLPKNATENEKKVATELNKALKAKTGKAFVIKYEGKGDIDATKPLVLIGNTSFSESKTAISKLADRSASIKIQNNKMTIAFKNLSSGLKMVEMIETKIKSCSKVEVKLAPAWTAKYTALPDLDEFVAYDKGDIKDKIEHEEDTSVLYTSYNNSVENFKAYCTQLETIGFEKVAERTVNGDEFRTYKGENNYIYAYYMKQSLVITYPQNTQQKRENASGIVKVMVSPIERLVDMDMSSGESATTNIKIVPIVSPYSDGGNMGYIFVLPDGRLLIVDGGVMGDDFIYKAIKKHGLEKKGKIHIAAWFITHPHTDHQDGYEEFIQKHGKDTKVVIERVVHNYTAASLYEGPRTDCNPAVFESCVSEVNQFYSSSRLYAKGVPLQRAHTGQLIDLGCGVTIEILFTVEDIVPNYMVNTNNSSMIFRIDFGEKTLLMTGDTAHMSDPMVIKMWGTYLKSDMVQVAHHGMYAPYADGFYSNYVKAEVAFVPATYQMVKSNLSGAANVKGGLEQAYNTCKDLYISRYENDLVVNLTATGGYTVINNKTTEWNKVKNYS